MPPTQQPVLKVTMNTSNDLYNWLPADERLANAICHGATVFVKNAEGDTGTIDKAVVKELCGCPNLTVTDALQTLVQNKIQYLIQYLPPTAPEVLELPTDDGDWWWWCEEDELGLPCWVCRQVVYQGSAFAFEDRYGKGYYVNASLYPKPNFNPVTGEMI